MTGKRSKRDGYFLSEKNGNVDGNNNGKNVADPFGGGRIGIPARNMK